MLWIWSFNQWFICSFAVLCIYSTYCLFQNVPMIGIFTILGVSMICLHQYDAPHVRQHRTSNSLLTLRSFNFQGFAKHLLICNKTYSEGYTLPCTILTKSGPTLFSINDMLVLFFNDLGLGYTDMKH